MPPRCSAQEQQHPASESLVSMNLDLLKRMPLPGGHLGTLRSSLLARSWYWHALYSWCKK
uniref:Uncharacterized protein n=1 Tax=Arundo donax TaxID=35708 RepID=A0A0A9E707_ARUDO